MPGLSKIPDWKKAKPRRKCRVKISRLASVLICSLTTGLHTQAAVNVSQFHNHLSRDGLYIDPAFTKTAAGKLTRDLSFDGTISGNVYAQPLYVDNGPAGRPMVIAVTQSNNVYALDAVTGKTIWKVHAGQPVPLSDQPCGNINPLGITGTPAVDLATRALLFDALVTPDNGATSKHLIYSLNVDTGTTNIGWPVDLNATLKSGNTPFTSAAQNERGAVSIVNGTAYVPYGGRFGDCGLYYGWNVGVPLNNPASLTGWATTANGGGAWSVGGVASDGTDTFIATGNTFGAAAWGGGEAIIRFQPGVVFSGNTADYWAPTNWVSLDNSDTDLGGTGPLLVDVPGATPSALILALGKDGNAYLLNRTNLGGVSVPLDQFHVTSSPIIQAAATYRTAQGTYVVFANSGINLTALRITPANPPRLSSAWTASENGRASPFVTSTDGTNNMVVWGIGAENDQRLHGFDADTGAVVYGGGSANELMAGTHRMMTGIAARGRIYIATDNKVYAFTVPKYTITLTNWSASSGFQFSFTNAPGLDFTVLQTTNITLPGTNWTSLGSATEISPGQFQFTDSQPVTSERFYRVQAP